MFPCEFRRGEVAQKTEVVGAASVDPNDRFKDTSIVTVFQELALDWPHLIGRCVMNQGAKVNGSFFSAPPVGAWY